MVIGSPFSSCLVSVFHLENRNLTSCYCWYWVKLNSPNYPGVWLPECDAEHSGDSHLRLHLVLLCCGFIEISLQAPIVCHVTCDAGPDIWLPLAGAQGEGGAEVPRLTNYQQNLTPQLIYLGPVYSKALMVDTACTGAVNIETFVSLH